MDQATSYTNFGFLREINENTTESCSIQSASDLKILLPTGSLYPITNLCLLFGNEKYNAQIHLQFTLAFKYTQIIASQVKNIIHIT